MTEFTDAEEAFIEASIPVLQAGEKLDQAEAEMHEARERATPFGEALHFETTPEDLVKTTTLLLEAARRAGYDKNSGVVQSLNEAHEEILLELKLRQALDEAVAERRTAEANPVI